MEWIQTMALEQLSGRLKRRKGVGGMNCPLAKRMSGVLEMRDSVHGGLAPRELNVRSPELEAVRRVSNAATNQMTTFRKVLQ